MKRQGSALKEALLHPIRWAGQKILHEKEDAPFRKLFSGLKKESTMGYVHKEALSAIRRMEAADPGLGELLRQSSGYAIFPRVGKASAVVGGAFGLGELFEHDRMTGYAAIVQLSLGVQLGGQTYNELLVFDSPEAVEEFKHSKVSFAANASAVMVTAGAAASAGKGGTKVFVQPEGGFGVEAAIGGQKFVYKPAGIGRLRGILEPPPATARA
jgi:hypothetical protein